MNRRSWLKGLLVAPLGLSQVPKPEPPKSAEMIAVHAGGHKFKLENIEELVVRVVNQAKRRGKL